MKDDQILADLYLVIRLALRTGARKEEVWSLKRHQINWQESTITFDETKNDLERTVSIPPEIMELLTKRPARIDTQMIFPSRKNPQKGFDFRNQFELALEKTGIKDFTWHSFRHTSASYYAMAGTPVKTMMEIFGWKTENMAHRYTHLYAEHKREWMETMRDTFDV